MLATKDSRCSMAMDSPTQIIRPTPNGIILIPLVPVMSTPTLSPPSRNRSGVNCIGLDLPPLLVPTHLGQTATMKFTVRPWGSSTH
uniref:Os10g0514425 protein n=1 Tax=Saccharum spontaneum TaxID=62335 RepID=A0A678T4M3_SACSP|nr:Os10g0514425 protein [Saccharum spontaneum]